jgi:GNAT superfamily N-acetyltransferase
MTDTMRISRAEPTAENLNVVLGLIEDARGWLWTKDTDQWEKPWPDEAARDARVLRGLQGGKTWIVWDGANPAATVTTTTRKNAAVWAKPACTCDLAERAVFVHRLITARKYAGLGLGAELIDWAGLCGRRQYGAKWIRIDVWTRNKGLHDFYLKRGFEPCGFCADPDYPSGALFQKPVSAITKPSVPQFIESPDQLRVDRRPEPSHLLRPA